MRYILLLGFSLVSIAVTFGCKDNVRETEFSDMNQHNSGSARVIADAAKPVATEHFNLLTQVQNHGLAFAERDGKLAISGVVTSLRWEKYEPTVFQAGDDLYVVGSQFGREGDLILWDAQSKRHHPLSGKSFPVGKTPRYLIIEDAQGSSIISTINPRTRQLEELWRMSDRPQLHFYEGTMQPSLSLIVRPIGMDQETIYFIIVDARATRPFATNAQACHLLMLHPEEPAKLRRIPRSYYINGHNTVREGRLLLSRLVVWSTSPSTYGQASTLPYGYGNAPTWPPVYEVSYWDIATNKIERLGGIEGYWDAYIGGYNLYRITIHLEWVEESRFSEAVAEQERRYPLHLTSYVVEETLQLYPMPLKHWPREARDAILHPESKYELLNLQTQSQFGW